MSEKVKILIPQIEYPRSTNDWTSRGVCPIISFKDNLLDQTRYEAWKSFIRALKKKKQR